MNTTALLNITLASGALLLSACLDSGSSETGSRVQVTAISESQSAASKSESGESTEHTEIRSFRRSDGMRIDLQVGLANVVPVELVPCTSIASLLQDAAGAIVASVIGNAWAHAGENHEDDVEIGYVNALNVHEPVLIGVLSPAAGNYCGIKLALDNGAAASKHGGEVDRTLHNVAVNVAPCYFHNTASLTDEEFAAGDYDTSHSCIQSKIASDLANLTLSFEQPLKISSEQKEWRLELAVDYEEWFDGITMGDLESVSSEQQKLLNNIRQSVRLKTIENI